MASTPPLASLRRPPLHACTGLRFIAALGVVGYHFYNPSQSPTAPRALSHLLQAGFNMVGLFFVLSGFILAFLVCWLWDVRSGGLPPWYEKLRTLLTLGAVVALGVALEHALSVG